MLPLPDVAANISLNEAYFPSVTRFNGTCSIRIYTPEDPMVFSGFISVPYEDNLRSGIAGYGWESSRFAQDIGDDIGKALQKIGVRECSLDQRPVQSIWGYNWMGEPNYCQKPRITPPESLKIFADVLAGYGISIKTIKK